MEMVLVVQGATGSLELDMRESTKIKVSIPSTWNRINTVNILLNLVVLVPGNEVGG